MKNYSKIQNFRVTSFSNAIVGTSFQKQPSLASHGNMTKTMVINIVSLFLFHGYALRKFQIFSHVLIDHITCFYVYQFFFLYLGKTLTTISGFWKPGHTGERWQIPSSTHFAILFFRLIQGLKIVELIIKISLYCINYTNTSLSSDKTKTYQYSRQNPISKMNTVLLLSIRNKSKEAFKKMEFRLGISWEIRISACSKFSVKIKLLSIDTWANLFNLKRSKEDNEIYSHSETWFTFEAK